MRIVTLSSLAFCLTAACGPYVQSAPAPPGPAGADIRYARVPDSSLFTRARLISLDSERLVFEQLVLDPADGRQAWVAGSLGTSSLAALQVKVGRRGNAGRGALIGAVVGAISGLGCTTWEPGWPMTPPSDGECLTFGVVSGAATGALIGLFVKSDVWAPAVLPSRTAPEPEPPVTLLR